MIIFTPNTVIKSADVNFNFDDLDTRLTKEERLVGFAAYRTGATDITVTSGNRAVLSSELFDYGNNYDTSLYEFKAPVKGMYYFAWTCYANSTSGRSAIWKNKNVYILGQTSEKTLSCVMEMAVNDIAFVRPVDGFSMHYYGAVNHNLFSGFLIKEIP